MTTLIADTVYHTINHALINQGCIIIPNFLNSKLTQRLYQHVSNLDPQQFELAKIGRNNGQQLNQQIRNDTISWLSTDSTAEQDYLNVMDECRLQLNRQLFLGLSDYESHFAHYASGHYYQRHIDAFRGRSNRVVTTVFYLNPDWLEQDGGELIIYCPDSGKELHRVLPQFGTMVIFLSEDFPHEVLAAKRDRYSISGWFRIDKVA